MQQKLKIIKKVFHKIDKTKKTPKKAKKNNAEKKIHFGLDKKGQLNKSCY